MEWQDIESAPKDGTAILAWCRDGCGDPECRRGDENYPTVDAWHKRLCLFHALEHHTGSVVPGPQILVWGGGFSDSWEDGGGSLPDWWFRVGSEFEEAANPTHWMPLPPPPEPTQSEGN